MTASFVDPPGGPATNGPAALVKGGGELGTAVALALWRAGWRVVVAELPRPTVLRRQLSLAEAAFCGAVTRDGVRARRVAAPAEAVVLLRVPQSLPLVVGLLPELLAGRDVDWVIETCPGPDLGRVIGVGAARPHAPLPRGAGSAAEEYVRAPHAGLWRTDRAIGDEVAAGERLGWLDAASLRAPVAGCLRGLVHDGVTVPAGAKLVAVHPGDWRRKESGIGQRAAAVAASVLQLAATRAAQHGAAPPGLAVALPAAAT